MQNMHFKWIFFLFFFGMQHSLLANTPSSVSPAIAQKITQAYSKSLPSLKIDRIDVTPIANLYQVISGPVVMYVTEDAQYAISGDILYLQDGKTNITEIARQKALTQALDQFGESNMIVYTPPSSVKQQYVVTVFTDLECSYCQKLHTQIDKMNQLGIKVRYIAFPREGKGTPVYDNFVSIWCAGDRKAAFNQAILGKTLPPLKCSNHLVDKQFRLGALAGVSGTPTFVIEGKLVPGYLEPEALLEAITQVRAQSTTSAQ